jgi:hypothetical protein
MNILILDDDEYRHEVFAGRYRDHWVVSVTSYRSFVDRLLSGAKWDLVHLDHDLGDLVEGDKYTDGWGESRDYTGMHAALKICELTDDMLPARVVIQSVNPEGARSMLQTLTRRGVQTTWEPFSVDFDDLDDQTIDPVSMTLETERTQTISLDERSFQKD